jgi:glutathione S-transferase
LDRLRLQMNASLAAIDRYLAERRSPWLVGTRLSQADVTAVCAFTFLNDALRVAADAAMLPSLASLAARCEAMPAFAQTREMFSAPTS